METNKTKVGRKYFSADRNLVFIISFGLLAFVCVVAIAIGISENKINIKQNTEDEYSKALNAFNNKNYIKSKNIIYKERALAVDPKKQYESTVLLGRVYSKMKEYDNALGVFYSVTNSLYSDVNLSYYLGQCYFDMGAYDMAVETFENTLQIDENHIPTLLTLAKFYMDRDILVLAKAYYSRVNNLTINDEAIFNLGVIAFEEGLDDKASRILNDLVKKNSSEYSQKASGVLGDIYILDGDTQNATKMYLKSLSSDNLNKDIVKRLISIYEKEDDYESIKYVYKQILKKHPRDIDFIKPLAKIYMNEKDYDNALTYYERLYRISEDDDIYETTNLLANAYFQNNNLKEAYKYYKKIAMADKEDSIYKKAIERLGNIAYSRKAFTVALKYYQDLVEVEENNEIFLPRLGELELYYGSKTAGIDLLIQSIEIEMGKAFPARTLAIYYESIGSIPNSIRYYQNTLEKYPNDKESILRLGLLYYKIREYQSSSELLYISAYDNENNPLVREKALYTLALMSEEIREYDDAIIFYNNLIKIKPSVNNYTSYASYLYRRLDYKNAIINYQNALKNNSDRNIYFDIHLGLAKSYFRDSDLISSEQHYRKALEYNRGNSQATEGLKQVLIKKTLIY